MAKVKEAPAADILTGYCMKTKTKGVLLVDAVVDVVGNKFIAKGHDGSKDKNKITTIVNGEKAKAAIAAGNAKKGANWPKK